MFVLSNVFIMGFHVVVGAHYMEAVTKDWTTAICKPVLFGFIVTIVCCIVSLPRTFNTLSLLAMVSAIFTFISVLLAAVFMAVQGMPANYLWETETSKIDGKLIGGEPLFLPWPAPGTTFTNFMISLLNVSFTFMGQSVLPSFIAEMENPREFPKALWVCTIAEVVVFSTIGIVIYKYAGIQYVKSPAFGNLRPPYKLIAFSFMIPTIIFLGVLAASITARLIYNRLFCAEHMRSHPLKGWLSWSGILAVSWLIAFLISQLIPFFAELLALLASLFGAFFGLCYWSIAWFRMRRADQLEGRLAHNKEVDLILIVVHCILIVIALAVFLVIGTYASVQQIAVEFRENDLKGVFSCKADDTT
ncbi:Fc.00g075150.m01.CDS01 [Cosmosporella sp. VM-42]